MFIFLTFYNIIWSFIILRSQRKAILFSGHNELMVLEALLWYSFVVILKFYFHIKLNRNSGIIINCLINGTLRTNPHGIVVVQRKLYYNFIYKSPQFSWRSHIVTQKNGGKSQLHKICKKKYLLLKFMIYDIYIILFIRKLYTYCK